MVGIRPEDLPAVNGDRPGAVLQGDVELVESLGAEQLVHFRIDAPAIRSEGGAHSADDPGLAELVENANVARIQPRHHVGVGDRISFAVAADRLEFFDPDTGAAIVG